MAVRGACTAIFKENTALAYGVPSGNRVFMGDNLSVMRAMLPEFARRFKCVYIDPPYNTGNTFAHYADDRTSSEWLDFMAERLALMRELLTDDGVLFVSIGGDEAAYLKVLLDSVFGRENYCGTLVWEKKRKPSFLDRNMGCVTEFILAYAGNRALTGPFIQGRTTPGKRYPLNNAGNALKILRFDAGAVTFGCPDGVYPPQDMSGGQIITRLLDALEIRHGRNVTPFRLEGEWRYSQEKLDALMRAGEAIVISRTPFRPNHIRAGGEPRMMKNLLSIAHGQMSTYEDATEESRALFGVQAAFDYPKPEKLIHTLLEAVTSEGDWVLDAFAGSGTTGAVAHKMNRRWVMIEAGPHCHSHLLTRLRKVVDGQDPGGVTSPTQWMGGGGFRVYQCCSDA